MNQKHKLVSGPQNYNYTKSCRIAAKNHIIPLKTVENTGKRYVLH